MGQKRPKLRKNRVTVGRDAHIAPDKYTKPNWIPVRIHANHTIIRLIEQTVFNMDDSGGILLEIRNVSKRYDRGGLRAALSSRPGGRDAAVEALKDVSLTIREGETLGIIGESGSGKSTLGYILSGIIKPDGGSVIWGDDAAGERRWSGNDAGGGRRVQMIFQTPGSALNPAYPISWILHEALRARGVASKTERCDIIRNTLPTVGLDDFCLGRYQHELSGGQKQRISILLALLMEPRLIVADEIVSSLDVSVRSQILNLLKDLQAAHNLSFLFISHDLDVVYHISHSIAVMRKGEIVECGPTEEICANATHPYTRTLFGGFRLN